MLPSKYRWTQRQNTSQKKNLCTKEIPLQILGARGIDDEKEIENFLKPTKEKLHSPYLLKDMDKTIECLKRCKVDCTPIAIYGDYDVDGVTSTSILYMFLKEQGYQVSYYIPNRQKEGYGLNKEALAHIATYAKVVITVDTGIAAIQEVDYGNEIGLQMIITDHHECQEELPRAYSVINPKRPDSDYPFESLAGVGVTFKLMHALAIELGCEEEIWKYIDIVALGTVADVVPLKEENRVLTYLGFKQMKESKHIGLLALLEKVGHGSEEEITSTLIGYQMGPRINAAGRLGDATIGVELLTTTDAKRAAEIATLLDEENRARQEMENNILEEAFAYIEEHIDLENEKVIVVAGKEWHHGVIGIVASRIMNRYYRPTFVLTLEEGVYSGSARSIEGFNIFDALTSSREVLERFGGHEMAAGLSLKEENLEVFKKQINSYAKEWLTDELLIPKLEIDTSLSLEAVDLAVCEGLMKLEPFGAGNPTPLFAIKAFVQYAQKIGQDKHLKVGLQVGRTALAAIGFGMGELADYLTEGEEVIVACEIIKNSWNGRVTPQLRIKDMCSPKSKILQAKFYLALYEKVKEPSGIEEEKILEEEWKNHFTKDGNLCYNTSCVLDRMIPSHTDCKELYKYLRLHGGQKVYLHKVVENYALQNMTEYKVLQILDVLQELSLIQYELIGDEIVYVLKKTEKTKLENSKRYCSLQHFKQNMS